MTQNSALLVIDMQVVLTESAYLRDKIVPRVAELIGRARAARLPVIFIQHESQGWPPLNHGTATWQIDPALAPAADDIIIHKEASDSFVGTDLHDMLAARGVTHLLVTGMQTEGCVDSTCRRALSLGYDVTLVADGHTTWDNNGVLGAAQIIAHHNATLADIPYPNATLRAVPAAEVVM
jgi:nicotinamidase-related amidase